MKGTVAAALSLALAVILVAAAAGAAPPVTEDLGALVTGNTGFAFDLYRQVKESTTGGNLVFSPISISAALAMTYAGARGETEKQMANVLHFQLPQGQLHPAFSALLSSLKEAKGCELPMANALWGQKGYKFLQPFLNVMNTYYEGDFKELDFAAGPGPSRLTINLGVEAKTRQKIRDLLQPFDITARTRLVITNAIYFKGSWMTKFDPDETRDASFEQEGGNVLTVPMMNRTGSFNYGADQSSQFLELPYAGDRLSMLILLPRQGVGLAGLERSLTGDNVRKWRASMKNDEVIVFIPKFKITARFDLKDPLAAMGMRDAFVDGKADFSGMAGEPDLYISKVIHKAFVEVNEAGTEAAAATAVTTNLAMSLEPAHPREQPVFRADHPFIFAVLDGRSGSILFLGRVMNPLTTLSAATRLCP
jgi:serpin B